MAAAAAAVVVVVVSVVIPPCWLFRLRAAIFSRMSGSTSTDCLLYLLLFSLDASDTQSLRARRGTSLQDIDNMFLSVELVL